MLNLLYHFILVSAILHVGVFFTLRLDSPPVEGWIFGALRRKDGVFVHYFSPLPKAFGHTLRHKKHTICHLPPICLKHVLEHSLKPNLSGFANALEGQTVTHLLQLSQVIYKAF